jgi:hypothetical protein
VHKCKDLPVSTAGLRRCRYHYRYSRGRCNRRGGCYDESDDICQSYLMIGEVIVRPIWVMVERKCLTINDSVEISRVSSQGCYFIWTHGTFRTTWFRSGCSILPKATSTRHAVGLLPRLVFCHPECYLTYLRCSCGFGHIPCAVAGYKIRAS